MSQVITYSRFWQRRDTAAAWALANPVLHDGEIGVEQAPAESPDVVTRWKVGDGETTWNALPYMGPGALPVSPGDILYVNALGLWQRLPKGTASQLLTMSGGFPTWATGSAAGGAGLTLLGTATVAGAAATTLTLSGLSLGAHSAFLIVGALDNATASSASTSLYFNADTTATNYDRQTLAASSTTVSAARANEGVIAVSTANETSTFIAYMAKDRDGRSRAFVWANSDAAASIATRLTAHVWVTATDVTGITLSNSVASSLAIGSYFTVFGVN